MFSGSLGLGLALAGLPPITPLWPNTAATLATRCVGWREAEDTRQGPRPSRHGANVGGSGRTSTKPNGCLTPHAEPATIAVGGRYTPKTTYRFEVRVPKRQVLPQCRYAAVRSALTSVCDAACPFSDHGILSLPHNESLGRKATSMEPQPSGCGQRLQFCATRVSWPAPPPSWRCRCSRPRRSRRRTAG